MTQQDEAITFEATTTIDDIIATQRHLTSTTTKAAKRRRTWRIALYPAMFSIPLFAVVLTSTNPWSALELFTKAEIWLHLISVFIIGASLAYGFGLLVRLVGRVVMRSSLAATRRNHPGVAADDPRLPLTRTYRFDEAGFLTTTEADEVWESWSRVTGLGETATLLIVKVGTGSGYPVPKAQLSDELRERLHLYIAARSASKWPF